MTDQILCWQPEDAEQRQTMFEEVEPPRPHSVFESPQQGSQQASLDGSVQAPAESNPFPTSSSMVSTLASEGQGVSLVRSGLHWVAIVRSSGMIHLCVLEVTYQYWH